MGKRYPLLNVVLTGVFKLCDNYVYEKNEKSETIKIK